MSQPTQSQRCSLGMTMTITRFGKSTPRYLSSYLARVSTSFAIAAEEGGGGGEKDIVGKVVKTMRV
jgi:hypothetical protein